MPAAIIAGTLIYQIPGMQLIEKKLETPYGSAVVYEIKGAENEVIFLPRHGLEHDTPPHKVNYRANLKALDSLGVKRIIAVNAVGSINKDINPLDLVVISDYLDFTSSRESTFFDGGKSGVEHVDMSTPYCPYLRDRLNQLAPDYKLTVHPHGVYVCTNGPRLESPAEIKMFAQLGGDVVGMTGLPEAVLAKELGLCYASVSFSINWAAGYQDKIEFTTDAEGLKRMQENLISLLLKTLETTADEECCN
jgi:5'-methylthioadenosine phosphorylase